MFIQPAYPLAFDASRNPISLPHDMAAAWRVRFVPHGSLKTNSGGEPERVMMGQGYPLYVPIAATLKELASVVSKPGLYRLDAVNRDLQMLSRVRPAYAEVPPRTWLEIINHVLAEAPPNLPPLSHPWRIRGGIHGRV